MANISVVWDFLKQNNNAIGNIDDLNDLRKAIDSWNSNEPWSNDAINNYTSVATAGITFFTRNSAAGNAFAIRAAALKLETEAGQYALGTTSFANVVQSFGG